MAWRSCVEGVYEISLLLRLERARGDAEMSVVGTDEQDLKELKREVPL